MERVNEAERLMPLRLKATLLRHGITHEDVAARLIQPDGARKGQPLSRASFNLMLNRGWRPARTPWEGIAQEVEAFLAERGVTQDEIDEIWEIDDIRRHSTKPLNRRLGETHRRNNNDNDAIEIETEMLSAHAKRHFSLFRDPFVNEIRGPEDLFLSADQRYVREAMYQASKTGGWFMAVVGESGSGKSTLRRDTLSRISGEGLPVAVIQPESLDKSQLTSAHICHAILADVKPSESPKRSLEALARQVKKALIESSRSGQSHVLMIEEAHDLNIQTLKYLKRFWEMEDGFKKLLSIVLIGQPELKNKLNERQYFDAREVIRRCEVVELLPLESQLGDYLALKFKCVDRDVRQVMEDDVADAIRMKLTLAGRGPQRNQAVSMTYPLVVNNLVTKAMNCAAEIGAPRITADIVRGC